MDRKTPTTPKEKLKKHDINDKKKIRNVFKEKSE